MALRSLFSGLRRALRRHRRILASALVGLAILAALHATSTTSDHASVLVLSRTVAGGEPLARTDLRLVAVPASLIPDDALIDPGAAVGQQVSTTRSSGTILTLHDLQGGRDLVAAGRVALPVLLQDSPAVSLLRVGDRIDLIGTTPEGGAAVIAPGVRVVALPWSSESGMLDRAAPMILVDLAPSQAAPVTAAGSSPFSFALR